MRPTHGEESAVLVLGLARLSQATQRLIEQDSGNRVRGKVIARQADGYSLVARDPSA